MKNSNKGLFSKKAAVYAGVLFVLMNILQLVLFECVRYINWSGIIIGSLVAGFAVPMFVDGLEEGEKSPSSTVSQDEVEDAELVENKTTETATTPVQNAN